MGRLRPSATVALLFTAVCQPFVVQGFVPGPPRCCTQHRLSTPRLSADPSEPQFDKYGLPLDYMPENQRRKIDFKDRFYNTIDAVEGGGKKVWDILMDGVEAVSDPVAAFVPSDRRRSRVAEATPSVIERRRAVNRLLEAKDGVVRAFGAIVDLPNLPSKAWAKYVTGPIQASRERQRRERESRRMALETALARYYAAKNTFYDTLDTIADTTRASVKAVKTVSRAVVETPARVTQTVNDAKALATDVAETVKRTTDQIVGFPGQVTRTVDDQVTAVRTTWASVRSLASKIRGGPDTEAAPAAKPAPRVEEIWEAAAPEAEGKQRDDVAPPAKPLVEQGMGAAAVQPEKREEEKAVAPPRPRPKALKGSDVEVEEEVEVVVGAEEAGGKKAEGGEAWVASEAFAEAAPTAAERNGPSRFRAEEEAERARRLAKQRKD